MRVVACAYPPDWSLRETIALPVFLDQMPPRGETGRMDFRLKGLISGLALQELFEGNGDWLLIDFNRQLAPQIFLIALKQSRNLSLDQVAGWLDQACRKLARAGARNCGLAISDLYRGNFTIKEFSEAVLRALVDQPLDRVKLYAGFELAELLAQELGRWVAHLRPEKPVELGIHFLPEFFEEK